MIGFGEIGKSRPKQGLCRGGDDWPPGRQVYENNDSG